MITPSMLGVPTSHDHNLHQSEAAIPMVFTFSSCVHCRKQNVAAKAPRSLGTICLRAAKHWGRGAPPGGDRGTICSERDVRRRTAFTAPPGLRVTISCQPARGPQTAAKASRGLEHTCLRPVKHWGRGASPGGDRDVMCWNFGGRLSWCPLGCGLRSAANLHVGRRLPPWHRAASKAICQLPAAWRASMAAGWTPCRRRAPHGNCGNMAAQHQSLAANCAEAKLCLQGVVQPRKRHGRITPDACCLARIHGSGLDVIFTIYTAWWRRHRCSGSGYGISRPHPHHPVHVDQVSTSGEPIPITTPTRQPQFVITMITPSMLGVSTSHDHSFHQSEAVITMVFKLCFLPRPERRPQGTAQPQHHMPTCRQALGTWCSPRQ